MKHGFTAKMFSERRSQHGQPVGGTRVRSFAGALELQRPAFVQVLNLAKIDRASVPQLSGPIAKLMSAVAHRVRMSVIWNAPAAEDIEEFL